MRIALLASATSVIPPTGQAAIERLAYLQALGLANRGHKVLFFALEGSHIDHPNVTIVPVGNQTILSGLGKEGSTPAEELYGSSYKLRLEIAHLAVVIQELKARAGEYDCILNNLRGEAVLLPAASDVAKPFYHVLHLPVFPELAALCKVYETKLISISNAQRKAFPDLTYAGTVYNAVDTNEFSFSPHHKNYLLYLGSIGKNKNPRDAVLAAKKAGVTLMIGGRIKDRGYYEKELVPHIDNKHIIWVGEMHPSEIISLYQGARAFLFPTMWEEPFGLVMIEAMSCGTPVIAYPHGAVPEVVVDGKNGYLVNSVDEMAQKITQLDQIDRRATRQYVEDHFSVEKMIDGYEKVLMGNIS